VKGADGSSRRLRGRKQVNRIERQSRESAADTAGEGLTVVADLLVAGRAIDDAPVAEGLVRVGVDADGELAGLSHHAALLLTDAAPVQELVSVRGAAAHAAAVVDDDLAADLALEGRRPGAATEAGRMAALAARGAGPVAALVAHWDRERERDIYIASERATENSLYAPVSRL
jgi:hypothetical protein